MSNTVVDEDDYPPPHPEDEKFTCPKWDAPGRCICGVELPPMSQWRNPGADWSSVLCPACGRGYVDEEEFIAIYDDGLDDEESNDA